VALCYAILDRAVFWVAFSITLFCAAGFFITAMWSWAEWLVYKRHTGKKWLAHILSSYQEQMWDRLPVNGIKNLGGRFYRHVTAGKASAVTSSRLVTASQNCSCLRRLQRQNTGLPVVGGELPTVLSGFVNATKTVIKDVILVHFGESSTINPAWEMETPDPVMIMGKGTQAAWFWSSGPNDQPVYLMLRITNAHSEMIKCASILSLSLPSFLIPFRHMQFNPGANHQGTSGSILATHSRGTHGRGAVRLWGSQDGSSAIHGFADLDTTDSGYKRYAWAPDGSRLLTRIDKETKVWSSVR
jgi:hypothetical protein